MDARDARGRTMGEIIDECHRHQCPEAFDGAAPWIPEPSLADLGYVQAPGEVWEYRKVFTTWCDACGCDHGVPPLIIQP